MLTEKEIEEIVTRLSLILNPRSPPYLIGKQLYTKETTTTLATTGTNLTIPQNANRVGLFLGAYALSGLDVLVSTMSPVTGGLYLATSSPNLLLNINDHGVMPQNAVYVQNNGSGSAIVTYIEMIWKPEG